MSALNKVRRALLAFDSTSHRWRSISLRNAVHATGAPPAKPRKQSLSLTSFNILASQIGPFGAIERAKRVMDCLFTTNSSSDIIHLQEVSLDVRQLLLDDDRVRAAFLLTDTGEHRGEFCTPPRCENMTLLSSKRFGSESASSVPVGNGDRGEKLTLQSVYHIDSLHMHRNVLGVDVAASGSSVVFRLLNLHLDPFRSRLRRFFQIKELANVLRELECSGGGVLAGDFDTIFPEEERFFGEHSLLDAWAALHGSTAPENRGAPWGSQSASRKRRDRVVMLGLTPHEIELIYLGPIERCVSFSDRCGLHCTFTM